MEQPEEAIPTETILGLPFYNGSLEAAIPEVLRGGLCCFPSGPGLAFLDESSLYRRSLQSARLLFIDSGFLALLWRKQTGRSVKRISGLRFLDALLASPLLPPPEKTLWVMPTPGQSERNRLYLASRGFELPPGNCYLAPIYPEDRIEDPALLRKIREIEPRLVFINIGGNIQEPLGAWLASRLPPQTSLLCTGAAIGFLSGNQTTIPLWADRIFLGWFFRVLGAPKSFFSRYWNARRLKHLVETWGPNLPGDSGSHKAPQ